MKTQKILLEQTPTKMKNNNILEDPPKTQLQTSREG
jgi:hypothetical protein